MSEIKNFDNTILALDLGTSSVKAIFAELEGRKIKILGSGKAEQISSSMKSGAILDITAVVNTCKKAISAAENFTDARAEKAIVGISGDFVKGRTSSIHYTRNPKKPISDTEVSTILEKIQEDIRKEIRKELIEETLDPLTEARLVDSSIISTKVDGKEVDNPVGICGEELEIYFYTAFAPSTQVSAIEKVCDELGLELIGVTVEAFAIYRAYLNGTLNESFSATFVDIGSETTDISLVKNRKIRKTKTFPIGFKHLEKDFSVWLSGLEMALNDLSPVENLPKDIVLSGGGAKDSDLCTKLATSDWYKKINFSRRPEIILLDPTNFSDFYYNKKEYEFDEQYATSLGLLKVAQDIYRI